MYRQDRVAFGDRTEEGNGNTLLVPEGLSSMMTGKQWVRNYAVCCDSRTCVLTLTRMQGLHRRTLAPLFSDKMLRYAGTVVTSQTSILLSKLEGDGSPHVLEVSRPMDQLSLDIIGEAGFGYRFNAQKVGVCVCPPRSTNVLRYSSCVQCRPAPTNMQQRAFRSSMKQAGACTTRSSFGAPWMRCVVVRHRGRKDFGCTTILWIRLFTSTSRTAMVTSTMVSTDTRSTASALANMCDTSQMYNAHRQQRHQHVVRHDACAGS